MILEKVEAKLFDIHELIDTGEPSLEDMVTGNVVLDLERHTATITKHDPDGTNRQTVTVHMHVLVKAVWESKWDAPLPIAPRWTVQR